jgi:hypothetical protein
MPNPPVAQANTIPPSTNPPGSDFLKVDSSVSPPLPPTPSSSSPSPNNTYSDFFDTSSAWTTKVEKPKKTPLEILTNVLSYVISILVFLVIIASIHVAFRTQERNSIAENYQFLCPYFNYDVDEIPGRWCKTLSMIAEEYNQNTLTLQKNIIELLAAYIPVKVSKNIIDASPEKAFIKTTYLDKLDVLTIMKQFDIVKQSAKYQNLDNINCTGVDIRIDGSFNTQCTIYGWLFGEDWTDGKLGSARIEALKFLDILSNTPKSQFRLLNPPSSLSIERLDGWVSTVPGVFQTRTTASLQLIYAPINQKP